MTIFSYLVLNYSDYLHFVSGLSLIVLSVTMLSLASLLKDKPLIRWASLFLAAIGVYEWSGLYDTSFLLAKSNFYHIGILKNGDLVLKGRIIILWLAFLLVMEGMRRSPRSVRKVPGWYIVPLLGGIGFSVYQVGLPATNEILLVFLGIPVMGWLAYRIFTYEAYERKSRAPYFTLPAISFLLIYTAAHTIFPNLVLRAFAAVALLGFSWFYIKLYIQRPRSLFMVYFPAIIFLTGVLGGGALLGKITEQIVLEEKREFLQLCRSTAAAIDYEEMSEINAAPDFTARPELALFSRQVELMQQASPSKDAVYIVVRRGHNKFQYVAHSHWPADLKPGSAWRNPPPELEWVFRTGRPVISSPYLLNQERVSCFVPILDESGRKIIGVLGTDELYVNWQRDIYARKFPSLMGVSLLMVLVVCFFVFYELIEMSDRKIYEREQRLRTILISIADGVIVTDLNNRITFINPVALSLTGWHRGAALNRPLDEVFRLENASPLGPGGIGATTHSRLVAKNGTVYTVATSLAPLSGQNGEVIGSVLAFRDMTDYLRAEEELRRERDFNDVIIANMPHVFFMIDKNGRFVKWNKAACLGMGAAPEEMSRRYAPDSLLDTDRKRVEYNLKNTRPTIKEVEMKVKTVNGLRDFMFSEVPLITDGNEYIIVFGRDITEAKQKDEMLRHALDFNESVIDNMPHVFLMVDEKGYFVKCNRFTGQLINAKPEDVVGKYSFNYLSGANRTAVERVFRKAFEETEDLEMSMDTPAGPKHYLFSESVLVSGGQKFLLVFGRDITDSKRKDEQLRLAAEEWARSFDCINDIMFITDMRYCVLRANSACARHTGIAEPVGKTCREIFKNGPLGWLFEQMKTVDFTAEPVALEAFNPADSVSMLVISSPLIAPDGTSKGVVFSLRDITDLKRAAREMEAAAEMKVQFLSVASHELRTPLSAISDSIDIVSENCSALPDEEREMIAIAKRNIDRLTRLINNILDFQRLESGKVKFNMESNDIGRVIEDVCQLFRGQVEAKGITLSTVFDSSVRLSVFDHDKITQVLVNIVGNAIKFTQAGEVLISAECVNDKIRVSVADSGPGIKPEDLGKLFKKFEQLADNAGRTSFGTGLGLVISRQIVEAHGGRIWAEARAEGGAVFCFELPLEPDSKTTIRMRM